MKNTLRAMSLSLILAAPIAFSLPAMAQVGTELCTQTWQETHAQSQAPALTQIDPTGMTEIGHIAQTDTQEQEYDAFLNSGYSYWDAKVLANFWGQELGESKQRIGRKMGWGAESKAALGLTLVDARVKALGSIEQLQLYFDSDFGYNDAEAIANYWGDPSAYHGKLRIERNLILGHEYDLRSLISASRGD